METSIERKIDTTEEKTFQPKRSNGPNSLKPKPEGKEIVYSKCAFAQTSHLTTFPRRPCVAVIYLKISQIKLLTQYLHFFTTLYPCIQLNKQAYIQYTTHMPRILVTVIYCVLEMFYGNSN